MGTPLAPPNFKCPVTGERCDDPGCKRDVLCVASQRELAEELGNEERARQWRIDHGKATLDDLDL